MNHLIEATVGCPYCGEMIDILIDYADLGQQYTEDCQVCCKPIIFMIVEDMQGELLVNAYSEDDAF
ncbi:hypothetical protein GCM10007916_24410 [Psychromonas marina]|uniref:CPXCG motif-containing cysteine-rich protein n=1 Tax=Psychromonas marina TaxID=88364 RepID=A0ABQ6E1Q4_9GAMM|nr:CPXCG motif-containing cysteine-rich protein [Psychromonas marina]GLS91372.1 hypothetical protein GCM10007916_24410 [Psychromonas marina]